MNIKVKSDILKSGLVALASAAAIVCDGGTLTVKFNSAMKVEIDGEVRTFAAGDTFVPDAIPCIYRMCPVLADGERTFAIVGNDYIRNDDKIVEQRNCRFPLRSEGNWVRVALDPYPAEDKTVELTAIKATGVYYVDATNGNDEWDGTADYENRNEELKKGPKKSLQAAHDAATGNYPIVLAASGTYNTGCATNVIDGVNCARRLLVTKNIGFIADNGDRPAFIVGERDPVADGGYGAESVNGVYISTPDNGFSFLQGFTITGCYSSVITDKDGGGFVSDGHRAYCVDCVISNNASKFYSATRNGVFIRTRIYENVSYRKVTRFGVFSSCIFAGNRITNTGGVDNNRAFHDSAQVYFCTYDLRAQNTPNGRTHLFISNSELYASLVYALTDKTSIVDDLWNDSKALDEPLFANGDAHDYRISVKSPAYNASSYSDDLDGTARSLMTGDVDGQMPVLHEGKISIGALWPKIWYVDQSNGNNANDGRYSSSAKATIKAATDLAFSGDTIYVAPGTYAEAEGSQMVRDKIGSRVVIPEDVTIESTDGAESTFIVGAEATGDQIDNGTYGTGTNAVRCVYAGEGAVVRGFTLTGGRGIGIGKKNALLDDNLGSAFFSPSEYGAAVEDCIISNNAICVGTIYNAVVRRCRVYGNFGVLDDASGSAGYGCNWYQSIIDHNFGNGTVCFPEVVEGCTIGANNRNLADSDVSQVLVWNTDENRSIVNTAVLGGKYYFGLTGNLYCTNCYVLAGNNGINRIISESEYPQQMHNTIVGKSGAYAQVDALYRPLPGAVSLIDNGDATYATESVGGTDVLGNPRIMNGALDIGAVEYDWCPSFSTELGKRFTIDYASPSVTTNASGGLVIPDGYVSGTVRTDGPYKILADMTGGTMAIYAGDVLLDEVSGAGSHSIRFKIADATQNVRIVYIPDEENPASAVLKAFANARGFVVGIR